MRDQRQCLDKLRQTEVRSEVKNVKFYLCSMDGRLDTRTEKFCNFDLQSGLRTRHGRSLKPLWSLIDNNETTSLMLALSIKAFGGETSWTVRGKTFDHNFILETRLGLPLSRPP